MRADLGTSSELVKENGREPMFTSSPFKIYGSWAWSHDGNVFVWRDGRSPYFNPVMLWKNSLGFVSPPPFRPGSTIQLELRVPGRAGDAYQMAVSMATSPMLQDPKTGLIIPLAVDPLLLASVQPCPLFHNFSGVLDAQGLAQASATVPKDPRLVGFVFYAAFVTTQAGRIQYVSDEVRIEIE